MRLASFLLLWTAIFGSAIAPASATMRISEDRGGQIGHYLQTFAMVRTSGERVVVDGNCLSACTLVLGLIPRSRVCATPRARFGFHAAWMPNDDGRPVTSPLGTQALWNIYPHDVRRWISRHGGLTRRMIYMQGNDLHGMVASCDGGGERVYQARVERTHLHSSPRHMRYRTRTARYTGGYSASDRH
jgi:hypothetical protein